MEVALRASLKHESWCVGAGATGSRGSCWSSGPRQRRTFCCGVGVRAAASSARRLHPRYQCPLVCSFATLCLPGCCKGTCPALPCSQVLGNLCAAEYVFVRHDAHRGLFSHATMDLSRWSSQGIKLSSSTSGVGRTTSQWTV